MGLNGTTSEARDTAIEGGYATKDIGSPIYLYPAKPDCVDEYVGLRIF